MEKYKYTGPDLYVQPVKRGFRIILTSDKSEYLEHACKVKAEVNINIATIKSVFNEHFGCWMEIEPVYVAAKYLEPVKPETIDFTNDDDKKSAQHIVDMITDDKDFEHLIGFQNFCESIMGMRFGNQHNDNHEIGGNHYKMAIEPWDYIQANGLGFDEGNIVKYASRHKQKNGAEDIRKIISYAKHILKTQYNEDEE